ncbi:acyl-CoA N-acyltransferase [Hyaloraphidium curvatum]|nr:acyl-CoA N-acyltransferase [Hyaloraphidium curvatum]
MANLPLGPPVDATPRPLPARVPHIGASVKLEPLAVSHVPDLWLAAQSDTTGRSFAYLPYGPFADEDSFRKQVISLASSHDPLAWAVIPHTSGKAEGWLTLMNIEPANAAIEIGNIWFSPLLQRTRAATEAMFLVMRHAMDDLGYRRMVWKCNSLNAPSRAAASRLGFVQEGILRGHMVVKGQRRDSAFYSILDSEWPTRRDAIANWLADSNWDAKGAPLQSLSAATAKLEKAPTLGA